MTEGPAATPTGRRVVFTRRERWWLAVYMLWAVGFGIFVVRDGHWSSVVPPAAVAAVVMVRRARPPTTVTPDGIIRPWRRSSFLPWSLIDYVLQPGHEPSVRVVTTTGRTIVLHDIEAVESARVADIGARPLKAEQVAVVRPIERERSQRDIEADVARRAARLAEERLRLFRDP